MGNRSKSIIGAIVIAALSAFAGGYIDRWLKRADPFIEVTNIDLVKVKDEVDRRILIDGDLQDLTVQSDWTPTLDAEIGLKNLIDMSEDLKVQVGDLEASSAFIPRVLSVLNSGTLTSYDQKQAYNAIIVSASAERTARILSTITATVSGELRRESIGLEYFGLDPQVHFDEDGELDISEEMLGFGSWEPELIKKVMVFALQDISEQIAVNKPILEKFEEKISEENWNLEKEFLNLEALYINQGGAPVSLDRYAAVSITEIPEPIFMVRDGSEQSIIIEAGGSMSIKLRSLQPLPRETAKTLRELYNKRVVKFILTTRNISSSSLSAEWVSSNEASFASYSDKLRAVYALNARKVSQ